ncbi:hypothetical protein CAR_c06540 [Carnobacterium sp. 17-4]|uniref:hypothetical protein n=1 Tax=Carnobacterium sp. (strain 17-4) TaxID=208596 RepID=UPI00020586CE|nr:hypothetical protein [Carnobacterium sp. 17-4]AEB29348.1 hypothetical protein CAR_c06540 [Carnobacterium sp. 17-4]
MNEKGAVLPSVMVFLLLMSIMILGTNRVFENQMNQLRMTKHYYEVESMLILSKIELNRQYDVDKEIQKGIVTFPNGTVTIQRKEADVFILNGTLKNVFSKQLEVQLTPQIVEELKVKEEKEISHDLPIEK